MEFNFDNWLNNLDTKSKPQQKSFKSSENKLNKIYSSFPDHHGTVYCIPFTSANSAAPFISIENVMTMKLNIDGRESSVKLLPKEFLTLEPGSKEEKLYGELVSLHRNLFEKKGNRFSLAKFANVYLMYAFVLKHMDTSSVTKVEKTPSLLIMSNKKFKEAFIAVAPSMTEIAGGTGWVSQWYNRTPERSRLVKIIFKKSSQTEYAFSINHEIVNQMYYGMTDGKDMVTVDQGTINTYFTDPVNDYLGVDKVEERFNYDWYLKVKSAMLEELAKLTPQSESDLPL